MSQLFTSYTELLQRERDALRYQLDALTEKYAAYLAGDYARCAVPECNNVLGPRLRDGYCTCSPACTAQLRRGLAAPTRTGRLAGPRQWREGEG